ncbi:flagella basal body P-ring formation protein FlgA [Gemmobacter megaterium]|uniref:Flagella basal body P-ring formation protein FlgA n=1 Tax=Gemmobacter megaterium TaxID=1086013 RepID=A0A1N7LWI3_9RHOB|nr:flagellar basal body P-ring formation chaperone FlgA [Gemmobacter megaterium]GGE10279.1 flagella basal body P-ring formation protein FlgA [Gemmobacter megaterium]SIS78162.1 flagella basal body P-ring formation protein FlgA [Gemmobacter megaterium]
MRWLGLVLLAAPVHADTLVATRTLRAQTVLTADDIGLIRDTRPGMLRDPAEAIGQEARVTLYAGRPIRPTDLGPPAIVERNQIVPLSYLSGRLSIQTEGRALSRGAVGDTIRVMNLASRSTVSGRIGADGAVTVQP